MNNNFFNRAFRVIKVEGFTGIKLRIVSQIYLLKLNLFKIMGRSSIVSSYGVKLTANYDDATFKFYVCGSYGYFYWNHLLSKSNNFIYLDIGANQGLYTICAAKNKKCERVYAFEPVENTFNLLKKNIILNNITQKCAVIKKAVSEKSETININIDPIHSGAASIARDDFNSNLLSEEIISINGSELDELVNFDNEKPIVIKIDVEGFEKSVILGLLSSNLIDQVVEIFYEIDENWTNPIEIKELLQKAGFVNFKKIGKYANHYDVLATK